MKTAYVLKENLKNFKGTAVLYRLDPPLEYQDDENTYSFEFVVSSAVVVPITGPETLIFPSNDKGNVAWWTDITGCRGVYSPSQAIEEEGYKVVDN